MKFKSIVFASSSGSVGGCTYSHNRYGSYIRNRSVPVNTNTSLQNTVRANFSSRAQAWGSVLTDAQRDSWNQYAAAVPRLDAFGSPQFVLGINWYIAMNTLRMLGGQSPLTTAPSILTGASLTPPVLFANDGGTANFDVTFTNTDEWATAAAGRLFCFIGGPTNPTRTFFKGPFKFADTVNGAVTPPTSPATIAGPITYQVDQRMHARFVAQTADGRMSAPVLVSAIAT